MTFMPSCPIRRPQCIGVIVANHNVVDLFQAGLLNRGVDAFGVVLYEMLTGKRAFEGASPATVVAAIMERPAPSVGTIAPPALDPLLQRCLAKDPDDR
jgi:serine/threonine protein kinase